MTTQQIAIFLEAANCLNFSEAAKRLFISQPTLSKQIAILEEEVGVSLFTRTTRSVTLTPSGRTLRGELIKIEAALGNAIQQAQQEARGTEGSLSCCVLDTIDPEYFVLPAIRKFKKLHPKINIEITICGIREIKDRLEHRTTEIAFQGFFQAATLPDVNYIPCYFSPNAVFVSTNHPLSQRTSLSFQDLKNEDFIILDNVEAPGYSNWLTNYCAKASFFPRIAKHTNSNLSRLLYVNEGVGISVQDAATPLASWMNVVKIPLENEQYLSPLEGNVVLSWRSNPSNPALFLFRDLISDCINEQHHLASTDLLP